jgi:hypothetical protein
MTEEHFQVEFRMKGHRAKPRRLILDGVRGDNGDAVGQG